MKQLNLSQMENLNGGNLAICVGASIVGHLAFGFFGGVAAHVLFCSEVY